MSRAKAPVAPVVVVAVVAGAPPVGAADASVAEQAILRLGQVEDRGDRRGRADIGGGAAPALRAPRRFFAKMKAATA